MPHHEISVEDILCKTKCRKSSKKCCPPKETPCNVECCIADCNPDCCTAAFQRLDKLRNLWLEVQMKQTHARATVTNRAGTPVNVDGSGTYLPLEEEASAFVNTVRYLNFEECGKLDQVTGWSVDVQSGDLYFYQNLYDLGLTTGSSTSANSRAVLLGKTPTELTSTERRQLAEMEPFWKLSLKAVERVSENPKTEGNICEIKDKCGNKFLVAINRIASQNGNGNNGTQPNPQSICDYNSQYSIVVVKLC